MKTSTCLTPAGRLFMAFAIAIVAAVALALLVMVPSRFGVSPG
jgi:hypothetical protein